MRKQVKVSAPGKLMLFGEHAVVYGKPCLVTAVDQRVWVSVKKIQDKILQINAPDVGIVDYEMDMSKLGMADVSKGVKFIEFAVKNFYKKYKFVSGVRVETKSEFSSEFGFGSSSAVTVSVIKALSELFDRKLSRKEIFELSYKTVLDVQGVGSGFDLAAAIWGGTIYFVGKDKKVTPIRTGKFPLVVGYTGIKADTVNLVKQVAGFYKKNKRKIGRIFDAIGNIVKEARNSFLISNYPRLGELMNENQDLLSRLEVNSPELKNLITAARQGGAFGAKLSGAGGGDCMIAVVSENSRKAVERSVEMAGGRVLAVKTGASGVRIEKQ